MQPSTKDQLLFHLRALSRFLYVVTDEEDAFLKKLQSVLKEFSADTQVYNSSLGLIPLEQLFNDWGEREHKHNQPLIQMNDALVQMYKDDPKDKIRFYVIQDPERYLTDPHIVRRFLNIAHQLHYDENNIKITIFLSNRKVIPEKLARYIEVIYDKPAPEDIFRVVNHATKALNMPTPKDSPEMFKGLTEFEIDASIAQSIVMSKKDPKNHRPLDPAHITQYRRKMIAKTDLVTYYDTTDNNMTFDKVGGAHRFKKWARKTRHVWTPEGRKYGLRIPKGVLLLGIWGTGKSISAKTLAKEWNVPLVQFEMGKLRASGVGESEANVYRVIKIIEAASPCAVWIDEAEKSLSGGQSSAVSDAGTTSRTLGIFSTWIQETTAPVCLILTANTLNTLPIEFVNRANKRFFFTIPEHEERIDILKIHMRQREHDPEQYNLEKLATLSENMVGREIEQAIDEALVDSFDAGQPSMDESILARILEFKPRIIKTMTDEVENLRKWVGFDAEANDGIRAQYASEPRREAGERTLVKDD